jgi:hypothetical protein
MECKNAIFLNQYPIEHPDGDPYKIDNFLTHAISREKVQSLNSRSNAKSQARMPLYVRNSSRPLHDIAGCPLLKSESQV